MTNITIEKFTIEVTDLIKEFKEHYKRWHVSLPDSYPLSLPPDDFMDAFMEFCKSKRENKE